MSDPALAPAFLPAAVREYVAAADAEEFSRAGRWLVANAGLPEGDLAGRLAALGLNAAHLSRPPMPAGPGAVVLAWLPFHHIDEDDSEEWEFSIHPDVLEAARQVRRMAGWDYEPDAVFAYDRDGEPVKLPKRLPEDPPKPHVRMVHVQFAHPARGYQAGEEAYLPQPLAEELDRRAMLVRNNPPAPAEVRAEHDRLEAEKATYVAAEAARVAGPAYAARRETQARCAGIIAS